MKDTRLNSFECMVLLQFFFHSMDKKTYPENMQAVACPDIYAFINGREIVKKLFNNKEKYDKSFDKLVKLGLIMDWIDFQHITYDGLDYINKL